MTDQRSPEDFEKLRKLVGLKRNELPPPGYFDGFSAKVIARIESGQAEEFRSWWQRLVTTLYRRPLEAAYCGFLALALTVVTVGVTQSSSVDLAGRADALQGIPVLEATLDWNRSLPTGSAEPVHAGSPTALETVTVGQSALAPVLLDFTSTGPNVKQVSYAY